MQSVLIDTNLLVLLIVGHHNKEIIGSHKKTKEFTPEDYDLLMDFLGDFDTLWITSHCIAETSNLLKYTYEAESLLLMEHFKSFLTLAKESHINKNNISLSPIFPRLGVADTGLVLKSKRVSCVLTDDFDVYNEITKLGRKVFNFNHIRQQSLCS